MKKVISILLSVFVVALLFVSCTKQQAEEPQVQSVAVVEEEPVVVVPPTAEQAAKYVKAVYDKSTKANPATRTAADFTVNNIVIVDGVEFPVAWSSDCADAVVGEANDAHVVTVSINPEAKAETQYTLTAVVTDPATGNTAKVDILHVLPKGKAKDMTYEQIVDMVYALESGENTAETYRLYGTVVAIPTVWSDQYKNITVNMVIDGCDESKIIQAYRLKGEGCETLKVGDKITVEGTFTNYKGTYEFNKDCVLVGFGNYPDQSKIVENIYQLATGEKQNNMSVLTGSIVKIVSAWSDQYGNITVDFAPCGAEEKIIEAYRLTGEGAKDLKVGDKITVYGQVKRYKDTFEFDTGCVLVDNELYNSVKNMIQAYELDENGALETARTITGVISSIPSAYSEQYGNITVNMDINGIKDRTVQAYRLTGGADLAVGDTITVTGNIKNYKGTVEFDKGCTYTK